MDIYFTEDNTVVPLLYRPTFEASLARNLHEYDRSFGALVLAVSAIASRYCDDPRVLLDPMAKQSAGWQWYRQIKPIPTTFATPPNIYNIQTYVVRTVRLVFVPMPVLIFCYSSACSTQTRPTRQSSVGFCQLSGFVWRSLLARTERRSEARHQRRTRNGRGHSGRCTAATPMHPLLQGAQVS